MAKPKRNKKFDSRASMPGFNSKRKRETEDFVGKFLLIMLLAFLISLIILVLYQRSA